MALAWRAGAASLGGRDQVAVYSRTGVTTVSVRGGRLRPKGRCRACAGQVRLAWTPTVASVRIASDGARACTDAPVQPMASPALRLPMCCAPVAARPLAAGQLAWPDRIPDNFLHDSSWLSENSQLRTAEESSHSLDAACLVRQRSCYRRTNRRVAPGLVALFKHSCAFVKRGTERD
jgi:hypothetical protein